MQSVVVADANVLLSAFAGKAARKALGTWLDIHTTEHTWSEMLKYLPKFKERYPIDLVELEYLLENPPVYIHSEAQYRSSMKAAKEFMEPRDPDDVHLAALAMELDCPVWSNDNDFKDFPTGRFTTAELLKILGY